MPSINLPTATKQDQILNLLQQGGGSFSILDYVPFNSLTSVSGSTTNLNVLNITGRGILSSCLLINNIGTQGLTGNIGFRIIVDGVEIFNTTTTSLNRNRAIGIANVNDLISSTTNVNLLKINSAVIEGVPILSYPYNQTTGANLGAVLYSIPYIEYRQSLQVIVTNEAPTGISFAYTGGARNA